VFVAPTLFAKLPQLNAENAVNGDFTLNERPVHIDFTKDLPPLPKDVEEKMKLLVEELNNPKKLDDNWTKFTIADKILSLVGDDDWHERNLPWMKLQQDVWWVKKANKWFTKTQCSTCEDYIQVWNHIRIPFLFFSLFMIT
jgi:hypothetical protein